MSMGQKWARFEKEYLPSDCNSNPKIWMIDGAGGDLLVRKVILKVQFFH